MRVRGAATRAAAAKAVDRVLREGTTLDRALVDVVSRFSDRREVSEVKAYAFGALRFHWRHRLIIERLLERPMRPRDAVLNALLSVGLYQLCHSGQPDYAVVSATVAAAKTLKRSRASGMINATLRRFLRERGAIMDEVLATDEGRFGHPAWIIERVRRDWPEHYETILASGLEQAPMWIRVNRNRTGRDAYRDQLLTAGIRAEARPGFPDALRLETPVDVQDLPGFDEGLVSVQDAASQLAAPLLGTAPGLRVLDACAAPGGKATHLLEICNGDLDMVAVDADADRLARIDDNLRRLGLKAQTIAGDVLDTNAWANGDAFDRILVDAPCSASGVIRRHPDIMFLRRPEDIEAMARTQLAMLGRLWPLLKPGGRLLYATCSVFSAENESVMLRFLDEQPDAGLVALPGVDAVTGGAHGWHPLARAGAQCLPGTADIDGIYYALMMRQS